MPLNATDDIENKIAQAIITILDTAAAVSAITGRSSGNVVPYDAFEDAVLPAIAYFPVTIPRTGYSGDTRQPTVQFTAAAKDGATLDGKSCANLLLHAVETTLNTSALIAAGLDACVVDFVRAGVSGRAPDGSYSADMDMTLLVTL